LSGEAAYGGRVNPEGPGYIGLCRAKGEAYKGLLALVGIEITRPAEAHTAFPGPLEAPACPAYTRD
jgi:hypothetical protein